MWQTIFDEYLKNLDGIDLNSLAYFWQILYYFGVKRIIFKSAIEPICLPN